MCTFYIALCSLASLELPALKVIVHCQEGVDDLGDIVNLLLYRNYHN